MKKVRRFSMALLAALTAGALALGAREAVATATLDEPSATYCTYQLPWNGPCGTSCNSSCASKPKYTGGSCQTYNHPTKGPIPCCLCGTIQ